MLTQIQIRKYNLELFIKKMLYVEICQFSKNSNWKTFVACLWERFGVEETMHNKSWEEFFYI